MKLLPADPVRRGRVKLALLAALFALPVAGGWLAYTGGWVSGPTANYGTLVPPLALSAQPFTALRGKWVLVHLDASSCDARCEQKLYYMRQVRRAQGREMNRVERLWIVTDAATPPARLQPLLEGVHMAHGDAQLAAAFPAQRSAQEHIYLVDPQGNLMMRFPHDPDPGRMLKDLARLLKYSRFG